MAPVSATCSNDDEGAPGPSHLGTGETANPNQSIFQFVTFRMIDRQSGNHCFINTAGGPDPREGAPGPSHLGTGETANPDQSIFQFVTFAAYG